MRQFFRDCHEWGWIPRRFDPARALATPRAVKALIGPVPRVIADDLWAKLLWAGLNLDEADLATSRNARYCYPVELVRALAVTWLFGGLRSAEIVRLRVGCVRWQLPADGARDRVCLLDVPAPQDRGAIYQTGRCPRGSGDRSVGGHPSRPTASARPTHRRTRGAPLRPAG
jgi:hypothetical protein